MRNTYIRWMVPLFVFVLAIVISTNIPSGRMFALQAGGGSAVGQSGTPGTGTYGVGSDQDSHGSDIGTPGNGMGSNPDNNSSDTGMNPDGTGSSNAGQGLGVGQSPLGQDANGSQGVGGTGGTNAAQTGNGAVSGGVTQVPNTDTASPSVPWGSIILSFIVGLVVGGLIFGRRPTNVDRTNLRRTA